MRLTNIWLKNMFHQGNREFFDGKLNEDTVVKFASLPPGLMGISKSRVKTITRPTTAKERRENNLSKRSFVVTAIPGVFISDKFRNCARITMSTLIHEMVHQSLLRKRDRKGGCNSSRWTPFNRRMLKLAKDGGFNGWW